MTFFRFCAHMKSQRDDNFSTLLMPSYFLKIKS